MMAAAVSIMGMAAIIRGTTMRMKVGERITPSREMTATIAPNVSDPESPMKIDAGLKL